MSGLSFFKSAKGRIILGTVVALHFVVYAAKPSFFKNQTDTKVTATPPKYLPEN